jgi:hypothetical protein
MIKIMAGVANYHNPAFIVLAFIVCFVGFFAAISLFVRAVNFGITQQPNRIISSAIVAGPTLWATFFIAFLGLDSGSRILRPGRHFESSPKEHGCRVWPSGRAPASSTLPESRV